MGGQVPIDDVQISAKGNSCHKKSKMTTFTVASQVREGDNTPLARSWRESSGDSSVIAPVIMSVQGTATELI